MTDVVVETIAATDKLCTMHDARCTMLEAAYAGSLARPYQVVTVDHPFREGNGRTEREFTIALAAERGRHAVDWTRVTGHVNGLASSRARPCDLGPLIGIVQTAVDRPTPPAPHLAPQ